MLCLELNKVMLKFYVESSVGGTNLNFFGKKRNVLGLRSGEG